MLFDPLNDPLLHELEQLERKLNLRPPARRPRAHPSGQPSFTPLPDQPSPHPAPSEAPFPTPSPDLFLSGITPQPLTWLWPQRIPCGKLTLLDGAPGCGTSLFALTLAAAISSGAPLPDGAPTTPRPVILIAPHDSPHDTLLPRLQAASGDPSQVLLLTTVPDTRPNALQPHRPFSLPHDLALLERTITRHHAALVILDPCAAIPGLHRSLLDLVQLAARTNCAILLTRSLPQPPADPLHPRVPTSQALSAARSHLLLVPDPADDRKRLLLTAKHPLSPPPGILSYEIISTAQAIPSLHWLGTRDPAHLARLSTGPLRSPHRQAILRYLQESPIPRSIQEILSATSYDPEAGRQMVVRMHMAGELVRHARGHYTTPEHPCLSQPTWADPQPTPPPPNVTTVTHHFPGNPPPPLEHNGNPDPSAAPPTNDTNTLPTLPLPTIDEHAPEFTPPVTNVTNISSSTFCNTPPEPLTYPTDQKLPTG